MNRAVLIFLIVASYTGGAIPMLIAFIVPYIRRAISRGAWITLFIFVVLNAASFIPFFIASHQKNPSALEALWLPMPLGMFFFFVASFIVALHSIPTRRQTTHEGEHGTNGNHH